MKKLPEVEQARAIMKEAMLWSVMKWLSEKKRVRRLADAANLTLDTVEAEIYSQWDKSFATTYKQLSSGATPQDSSDLVKLARDIRKTHDAALATRMEAEDIFDRAEKRLSTALAREGCQKAIHGWDQHEQAIALAEKAPSRSAVASKA